MPAFPDAEYAARLAKTRAEMERRSLDVLLPLRRFASTLRLVARKVHGF